MTPTSNRLRPPEQWRKYKIRQLDSLERSLVLSHLENGIVKKVLVRIDGDPRGQMGRLGGWFSDLYLCWVLRSEALSRHGDGQSLGSDGLHY